MKLWTLMCMLAIFHISSSMPKMVRIRISKVLLTLVTKKHSNQFLFAGCHAEHFAPLFEQIAKLDEALYNIQFEQHWLEAQTDRQAICKYFLLPSP